MQKRSNIEQFHTYLNTVLTELLENQIKTRAYPFKALTHAGEQEPYIHVQARIKSGRDAQNKAQLGAAILRGFEGIGCVSTVVNVEVIDMHRESYAKRVF